MLPIFQRRLRLGVLESSFAVRGDASFWDRVVPRRLQRRNQVPFEKGILRRSTYEEKIQKIHAPNAQLLGRPGRAMPVLRAVQVGPCFEMLHANWVSLFSSLGYYFYVFLMPRANYIE